MKGVTVDAVVSAVSRRLGSGPGSGGPQRSAGGELKRAVFLDRDGTLIEEVGYLDRIDRVRFFPYSIDAVRLLNRAGFVVIVATNQAGIARGYFDEAFVEATHRSLAATLAAGGARVDAFYFCPHHPEAICRVVPPGVRVPKAAAGPAPARGGRSSDSTFDVRSSSATVRTTSRPGPPSARTACSSAPVTATRRNGPDHGAAAVTDNLIGAVSWILRQP